MRFSFPDCAWAQVVPAGDKAVAAALIALDERSIERDHHADTEVA
jgi:hypothetical protein